MSLPVAILAGGLGTRLGGLTADRPKVLIEVAGRPFVFHQLALLQRAGLTDVVLCIGHLGGQVVAAVGDGGALGVRVRYSDDGSARLGTGGAVRRALPLLGPAFFVLYGDSYLPIDYGAVERAFAAASADCDGLMTVMRNHGRWDRSNIRFADRRVLAYDKRAPTPDMDCIDYGLSIFKREAVVRHPDGAAFDLGDLCAELAAAGRLAGHQITERFYEIGSAEGLADAEKLLADRAIGPS
jgi:NDP-sugar pyrophosphorylase family protein